MNTFLICLNIALTACTSFLLCRAICLHPKVEETLKKQIKEEMVDIKTHVTLKCIDLEKAIRAEGEITQDDLGDLKEDIKGIKREVKSTIIEQLIKPEVFFRVLKGNK